MDGEDYFTMSGLLVGPVRRRHPNACRCFTENAYLVVVTSDTGEHRYPLSRESTSLTLVITP